MVNQKVNNERYGPADTKNNNNNNEQQQNRKIPKILNETLENWTILKGKKKADQREAEIRSDRNQQKSRINNLKPI